MDWYEEAFRVTVVLVAASVVVLVPGFAGLGGSLPLVAVAVVLAGGLYAVRDWFETAPTVMGHDLASYGRALWASPLVAAAVLFVGLGTTPGELRVLGGIVGLAGMANYFLRPIYALLAMVLRTLLGSPS